ncbi:exopolyphosphatase / guanosine-5'-triphosphate,3'-diphosphate pyrophosphatase [Ruania alba]|uniref:Exopolyphosphatase / guanosine-5'-triphosphate,3'-diphosphate pyrophosphatase n=1 Tax=Ruania alba TaxID=648782 RepID=A0A1H5N3K8_9MICO|nr:exopolyphosphatase / guanosine-5'-triphosphate,3'-diphosphate pyrophosphatase [Ruania alba]
MAAIDCGTNSIRLLIADRADGRLTDVTRLMEVVRLGQGVDRTGEFDPVALDRTLEATTRYARLCEEHEVEAVRFVATSATRDARNRDVFLDGVRAALGIDAEVISGGEEASLSFAGAVSILGEDAPGDRLVVDIGGGSTELVLGGGQTPDASISLDMGCVRMTERHLHDDPPTAAQIASAVGEVRTALDRAAAEVPLAQVGTVVGVAGSVTTVTAHALGLESYQRERINATRLPIAQVRATCADLLAMPRTERAALGFMHPGRVDVIGAGALIWSEVLARVAAEVSGAGGVLTDVITSEHDILDGIALSVQA